MCRVLDEETTSDGGVRVEAYFELAEEGEKVFFDLPGDGVIVALEDGGEDGPSSGLDIVDLLDVRGFEVGETELLRSE